MFKKILRFIALLAISWIIAMIPSGFAIVSLPEKDVWVGFVIHIIVVIVCIYFMFKYRFLKL